jgi:tRNA pseudouridine38-40 synthase
MRTLKLTVAYDGTDFVGWQRQDNGVSVQQRLEEALAPFEPDAPRPLTVEGASRTDAGVHAAGQVASVRVRFEHPVDAVRRALNIRLPTAIRVLSVEDAAPGFHARFDARSKRYRYRISTVPVVSPLDRWFVWHVPRPCNVAAMREAASSLVGSHDFASFQATGSSVIDTRRIVHRVDIVETPDELHIEVEGDGFLRHMVRIMSGSLVDVGLGTFPADWMARARDTHDRRKAGRTAPASGLILEQVHYDAPDDVPVTGPWAGNSC